MAYALKRLSGRKRYRDGIRLSGNFGLCYGTLEDLSSSGMRLHLENSLPTNEKIQAQFSVFVPGEGRVAFELPIEVVRCEAKEAGLELGCRILEIDPREERFLSSLVEQARDDILLDRY